MEPAKGPAVPLENDARATSGLESRLLSMFTFFNVDDEYFSSLDDLDNPDVDAVNDKTSPPKGTRDSLPTNLPARTQGFIFGSHARCEKVGGERR